MMVQASVQGTTGSPLEARVVLVTGASKGIGAVTARALGEAGASVVAHYGADRAGAEQASASISDDRKLLIAGDFSDAAAPSRVWDEAVTWRGAIDVLVSNAGIMDYVPFSLSESAWREGWQRLLDVNLLAPAALIRSALPHFVRRGGGVIITLSSWVAQRGPGHPDLVAYAASKAAIRSLTQTVARHHARDGILAYVIAPGAVHTRLTEQAAARTGGPKTATESLAMGEWIPPEEIADLIVFLARGRARHLSGATLDVNGASYIR
jgi:NAD(P)-dependent dehydrogenase (short-subunit alcohol dehydrogenase family)